MKFRKLLFVLALTGFNLPLSAHCPADYLNESQEEFKERMQWFVDAKFGMFVHFGLYSSLGGVYNGKAIDGYAEWIQHEGMGVWSLAHAFCSSAGKDQDHQYVYIG